MQIRDIDFSSLPADALRVYLLFSEIEEGGTRTKMSVKEASMRTGVPSERFLHALDYLKDRDYINQSKGLVFTITRDDGLSFDVQFVKSRTDDDSEWQELINENNQLKKQLNDMKGETCGLDRVLPEAPAQVFRVAEGIIQRGMTYEEVFYLTELVVRFGTKRVITALYDGKNAKQPLRAAYVMLRRGRLGKGKETNTNVPEPVEYPNIDKLDPWGGGNNEH